MFGYTVPLFARMPAKELGTYQRFYCETCHQLRDGYGLVSTAAVNYDMTFNLIVLSAVNGDCTEFEGTPPSLRCVLRHSKADSEVFRMMAGYTVLLTKWEIYDDMVDKPGLKTKFVDLMMTHAIQKAEGRFPEADVTVGKGFGRLRELELEDCTDPVYMGKEFGKSLAEPMVKMAPADVRDRLTQLYSDLTQAIYLIDAIDDLDSDFMDGTFNALLTDREHYVNRKEFLKDNTYLIAGTLKECFATLQGSYEAVREDMGDLRGITDNIIYFGLPESAKKAMEGTGSAKLSLKNALDTRSERTASYRSAHRVDA